MLSLSPPDDATGVRLDANLVITFNQPVQKGAGDIVIKRSSDGSTFQTISVADALVTVSGAIATIRPATVLERRAGFYVEVAAGAFEDLSGNSFAGISGPAAWDFTTVGPLVADDAVTTKEDTLVNVAVLSNDLGIGRPVDPATLAVVAGPAHGTVTVNNGWVIYTPAGNFSGTETFRYTVRDVVGFESNEGTVTVTVTAVADYQNAVFREDVNQSGAVTPLDVLIGINYINANGGQLPPDPTPPSVPAVLLQRRRQQRAGARGPVDRHQLLEPRLAGQAKARAGTAELPSLATPTSLQPLPYPELLGTADGADVRQLIRSTLGEIRPGLAQRGLAGPASGRPAPAVLVLPSRRRPVGVTAAGRRSPRLRLGGHPLPRRRGCGAGCDLTRPSSTA